MKYILSGVCTVIIAVILFLSIPQNNQNSDYMRIHIKANSNIMLDQNVKYQIKDKVVDYLIPYLAQCENKEQSMQTISNLLPNIEHIATKVLKDNNLNYNATANILNQNFPTRYYGDICFEEGYYDALIINLGEAKGDNWWCVVYPPLCFVNGGTTTNMFKSRILEIINNFK